MQRINGAAKMVETTKGQVDLDAVLNIKAFSLQKVLDMEPDFMKVHFIPTTAALLGVHI